MRRVFEGGDGWINGGIEERSRDSGVCVPLEAGLEDCETGGEVLPFDMIVTADPSTSKKYSLIFPSWPCCRFEVVCELHSQKPFTGRATYIQLRKRDDAGAVWVLRD